MRFDSFFVLLLNNTVLYYLRSLIFVHLLFHRSRTKVTYASSAAQKFFTCQSSLISYEPLTLDGHRGITTYVAKMPVFRCPRGISKPYSCNSVFPSLLPSSSLSCAFHFPLQNCLRHARESRYVAIPSEFSLLNFS